jgi:hypothetical protein
VPRRVEINESSEEDELEGPNGYRPTLADFDRYRISHLMDDIPFGPVHAGDSAMDTNTLGKTLGQSVLALEGVIELLQKWNPIGEDSCDHQPTSSISSSSIVTKSSSPDFDTPLFRVSDGIFAFYYYVLTSLGVDQEISEAPLGR